MGGAMTGTGRILKRALGGKRIVNINPDAERIMDATGVTIPLSQSGEGLPKIIYEGLVGNIPGSSRPLRDMFTHAMDRWGAKVHEAAVPKWAGKVFDVTDKPGVINGKLQKFWDTAFDDIKGIKFVNFYDDWLPFAAARRNSSGAIKLIDKFYRSGSKWPIPRLAYRGARGQNVEISGKNLLEFRTAVQKAIDVVDDVNQKDYLIALKNQVDKSIERNLNPTGKGTGELAQVYNRWVESREPYKLWTRMKTASKENDKTLGFTPEELLGVATRLGGDEGLAGTAPLQEEAASGARALPKFMSNSGLFQTLAALGTGTSIVGGMMGSAPVALAAPAVVAASRGAATEGFQKYLMGRTNWQKVMAELLRRNKGWTVPTGKLVRQAVVEGVSDGR